MKRIALNGRHGKGKFTLVSDEDFEELSKYRWVLDGYGYAVRSAHKDKGKGRMMSMHRQILKTDAPRVDHEDTNPLNNQRENLRPSTHAQNLWNRGKQVNNKSGYKGVCKISDFQRRKCWIAQIAVKGKHIHLGYYHTPEEAHEAYKEAVIKYHGKFGRSST